MMSIIGSNIRTVEVTESTNSLLKAEAEAGLAQDGAVVRTHYQMAGKGRLDRKWEVPPGMGLMFSILLKPGLELKELQLVGLMASLAVYNTLSPILAHRVAEGSIQLKWPNDVLIDGEKICGILCESGTDRSGDTYIVVGIGLNVLQRKTDFPAGLRKPATSLYLVTDTEYRSGDILKILLDEMNKLYSRLKQSGSDWIPGEWLKLAGINGRELTLDSGNSRVSGICEGIDEFGGLILKLPDGIIKTIYSGDVF